jgi:hypothetical protein
MSGNESVLGNSTRETMLQGQIEDTNVSLQGGFGYSTVAQGFFVPDNLYPYPFATFQSWASLCGHSVFMTVIPAYKFAMVTMSMDWGYTWFTKTLTLAVKSLLELPTIEPLAVEYDYHFVARRIADGDAGTDAQAD